MLTATLESTSLAGLGGSAAIENLQNALTALAQVANWPSVNPGPVDGLVGTKTLSAVIGVISSIKEIPSSVRTVLGPILALAMTNDRAKAAAIKAVSEYAAQLTVGVTAAIARYAGSSQPGSNPQTPPADTTGTPAPGGGYFITKGGASPFTAQGISYLTTGSGGASTPFYKSWKTYAIAAGVLAAGYGAYRFAR